MPIFLEKVNACLKKGKAKMIYPMSPVGLYICYLFHLDEYVCVEYNVFFILYKYGCLHDERFAHLSRIAGHSGKGNVQTYVC